MKRETERGNGLIVVGVDSSDGAKEALRFAIKEAKLRQAALRVVQFLAVRLHRRRRSRGFGPGRRRRS